MAIIPSSEYPGKINASSGPYPLGSARNVSAPGAGDGTPLLASWVNDIWGFLQTLLTVSGVTANGTPDSLSNMQYHTALVTVINNLVNANRLSGNNVSQFYAGLVNGDGSSILVPSGWTPSYLGSGYFRVTHNLGGNNYAVNCTPQDGNTNIGITSRQINYFEVRQQVHNSDQVAQVPFHFHLDVIRV